MARLVDIAADMERQAKRRGVAIRDLPWGLRLQLVWVGGQKILALSRPATMPSEGEISSCRFAFHVPGDARRDDNSTTVELRWPS